MENCPLAAASSGYGGPQQYYDLLTKVFMTDMGVQPHDFVLHAFMSVDSQQLLPLGVRDSLNRRHAYVQVHSPLGSSWQGAAKAPGGRCGAHTLDSRPRHTGLLLARSFQ
jgi:hypothetical protein